MRIINILAMLLLSSGLLSATTQITTFGHPHGIVSDTNEWICYANGSNIHNERKGNYSFFDSMSVKINVPFTFILGSSKSLPMKFQFFKYENSFGLSQDQILQNANLALAKYACRTSSIIRDSYIKEISATHHVVYASFLDNTSSGYIAIHVIRPYPYIMFVELRSEAFDESTREDLMNKPAELITPLFKPKQLASILGIKFEDFSDCIIVEESEE